MERLLREFDDVHWDVVVVNETKRESDDESFGVDGKHMFYGNGEEGSRLLLGTRTFEAVQICTRY